MTRFLFDISSIQSLLLGNSWEDFPQRLGAADGSEEMDEFEVSVTLDNVGRLWARCHFPDSTE